MLDRRLEEVCIIVFLYSFVQAMVFQNLAYFDISFQNPKKKIKSEGNSIIIKSKVNNYYIKIATARFDQTDWGRVTTNCSCVDTLRRRAQDAPILFLIFKFYYDRNWSKTETGYASRSLR
jgi:hypothetical protein